MTRTEDVVRDVGGESKRDALFGSGFWFGGLDCVGDHWLLFRKRGKPWSAELTPPRGQAGLWFEQARRAVPLSGQEVARQIARLCGDDSEVALPWRSVADAVGRTDRSGRKMAFTERGVETLVEAELLEVETVGRGRGARTTWRLL